MSALPHVAPATRSVGDVVPAAGTGRLVAIAEAPTELLRPGSELARLVADCAYADLLIAGEEQVVAAPGPIAVLGGGSALHRSSSDDPDLDGPDLDDPDLDDDPAVDPEDDPVVAGVEALAVAHLHVHRLALVLPLTGAAENDLVAALSELVGFDPEPGVVCLAPQRAVGAVPSVVERAVLRIARGYGLPLRRYRSPRFVLVGEG